MAREAATQQVVHGTNLIAKGLAAEIIAEGIEAEEEGQFMRVAGCQQLRGHFFSKPVAVASIGEMLNKDTLATAQATAWTAGEAASGV